jgi:hypothetical protein
MTKALGRAAVQVPAVPNKHSTGTTRRLLWCQATQARISCTLTWRSNAVVTAIMHMCDM